MRRFRLLPQPRSNSSNRPHTRRNSQPSEWWTRRSRRRSTCRSDPTEAVASFFGATRPVSRNREVELIVSSNIIPVQDPTKRQGGGVPLARTFRLISVAGALILVLSLG